MTNLRQFVDQPPRIEIAPFKPVSYRIPSLDMIVVAREDASYSEKEPWHLKVTLRKHNYKDRFVGFSVHGVYNFERGKTRSVPSLVYRAFKHDWAKQSSRFAKKGVLLRTYLVAFTILLMSPRTWHVSE